MADYNKNNNSSYRSQLSVEMGRGPIYHHDANGYTKGVYTNLRINYWSNMVLLKFSKRMSEENVLELTCFLSSMRVVELGHMLEGMMGRRRDAFMNDQPYSEDSFRIPLTKFDKNINMDTEVGDLTVATELVDGIPRVKLTYYEAKADKRIDVVFYTREVINVATSSFNDAVKIDIHDVGIYLFLEQIKLGNKTETTFGYNTANAIVNAVSKFFNKGNDSGGGGGYDNNRSGYSNRGDDIPPY